MLVTQQTSSLLIKIRIKRYGNFACSLEVSFLLAGTLISIIQAVAKQNHQEVKWGHTCRHKKTESTCAGRFKMSYYLHVPTLHLYIVLIVRRRQMSKQIHGLNGNNICKNIAAAARYRSEQKTKTSST
jgi:hypothetical protein